MTFPVYFTPGKSLALFDVFLFNFLPLGYLKHYRGLFSKMEKKQAFFPFGLVFQPCLCISLKKKQIFFSDCTARTYKLKSAGVLTVFCKPNEVLQSC